VTEENSNWRNTPRERWSLEQQVAYQMHLDEERKAWKEHKKRERVEKERREKRAALDRYLHRRGQEWMDYTGMMAPFDVVEGWRREYIAGVAVDEELELELRRQASIEENYRY
jgi:hypothetical protein